MKTEIQTASLSNIQDLWAEAKAVGQTMIDGKIRMVNCIRHIGLTLQGLCQHNQMKLSFYENIKAGLPADMDFAKAQRCIAIANKHPEEVTTIEQANAAEQMILLAVGQLEPGHREEKQRSHSESPVLEAWTAMADFCRHVERLRCDSVTLGETERVGMAAQIRRTRAILDALEVQLGSV